MGVTGITQEFSKVFLKVGGISEVGLLKTCKYVGPTGLKYNPTPTLPSKQRKALPQQRSSGHLAAVSARAWRLPQPA